MVGSMKFVRLSVRTDYREVEGYRCYIGPTGSRLRWWLARKAWQWLQDSGALVPYLTTDEVYEFSDSAQKEILGRTEEAVRAVLERGERLEDYALLVGAADFRDLTGAVFEDHYSFRMEHTSGFVAGGYRAAFRGVMVHVVPNMAGVVVVPKVAVEKTT